MAAVLSFNVSLNMSPYKMLYSFMIAFALMHGDVSACFECTFKWMATLAEFVHTIVCRPHNGA